MMRESECDHRTGGNVRRAVNRVLRIHIALTVLFAVSISGCSQSGAAAKIDPHKQPLEALKAGNRRFCTQAPPHPHMDAARRHDTAIHGQHPFAAVVACSDSRVPVEDLMGAGIGDIFVIRVAGNVCMTDETGSVDYAVEHLHVPLVVVLGHTGCGAVTAAVKHSPEHGSITRLLNHIDLAVGDVRGDHPELKGDALIAASIEANVWRSIEDLITHSASIRDALRAGELEIQGAIYDLDTGEVRWLGSHPRQNQLAANARDDGFGD